MDHFAFADPTPATLLVKASDIDSNFNPNSIKVDSQGNIYIVDKANSVVYKFDSNGQLKLKLTDTYSPQNAIPDSKGNIYILTFGDIKLYNPDGKLISSYSQRSTNSPSGRYNPSVLGVDNNDNLLILDTAITLTTIKKFDSNWNFISDFATVPANTRPVMMNIDNVGNVFYMYGDGQQIMKFDNTGKLLWDASTNYYCVTSGGGGARCNMSIFDDHLFVNYLGNYFVRANISKDLYNQYGANMNRLFGLDASFSYPFSISDSLADHNIQTNPLGGGPRDAIFSTDNSGNLIVATGQGIWKINSATFKQLEELDQKIYEAQQITIYPNTGTSSTTNEDKSVKISWDEDKIKSLKFSITTSTNHGNITGNFPNLTYTPNPNYFGQDIFYYLLSNEKTQSNQMSISIDVASVEDIPVADAGPNQSVKPSDIVQLDASKSSDGDNDPIKYSWIQTAGSPVTLTDKKIANPKFTAPNSAGQLTFMLTVNDGKMTSDPAVVNVYVGATIPTPTPPPSPTEIAVTSSNGALALKWSPPTNNGGSPITDYVIEYKLSTDKDWRTFADGTSANTQTTITGLKNDQTYQVRISSVNSVGTGDKSSPINAIPKLVPTTPPPTKPTVPETKPTPPPTKPTVPETKPTVTPTKPTVPETKPTVTPTKPTVTPTKTADSAKASDEKAKKIQLAKEKAKERALKAKAKSK